MTKVNKTFLSNVAIVSFGPIFASILGFFAEPWIARFWGPRVFGIGSYYNSVINIVSVLLFFRYNFAIVQAKTKEEAHNLLALCIILLILLLVILDPFYGLLSRFAAGDFPFHKYKLVMFLSSAFAALAVLFRFWYSGQKKFIAISASSIILSLSNTTLLLIYGKLGKASEENMIYIRVFSTTLVGICLMAPYVYKEIRETLAAVSWKKLIYVAKLHYRYPMFEFWGFAANTIAAGIPVILVARYWGQEMNGLYSKSFNLLQVMVLLIGNSVNRVLHKEVADIINRKEDASGLLSQTCIGILKYSILPTMFLVLLGPEFFSVLLGARWKLSGIFAQYLSIWTIAILISTAYAPLFGLYNKQKQYTIFTVITLILMVGMLVYMGKQKNDIVASMAVFAIVNFITLIVKSGYILHVARVNIVKLGQYTMTVLFRLIPYIAIIWILKHFTTFRALAVLVIGCILTLPYLYLFYVRNSMLIDIGKGFFAKKFKRIKS